MQYILVDRRVLDQKALGWEQMHACLVVAEGPSQARHVAATAAGGEGAGVWIDQDRSSVLTLGKAPDQEPCVLMTDFAS